MTLGRVEYQWGVSEDLNKLTDFKQKAVYLTRAWTCLGMKQTERSNKEDGSSKGKEDRERLFMEFCDRSRLR